MLHITHKMTTVLAGLAVASLPVLVDAQGSPTSQTPTSPISQPNRSANPDQDSPQHHLDEARKVLTSITGVQGEALSKMSELKRHFTQLETAWRASSATAAPTGASRSTEPPVSSGTTGSTSGTGTAGTSGTTAQTGRTAQSPSRGSATGDWMKHYTAIDDMLDQLLDSNAGADASMSGSTGTTSGTTSGTTAGTTGSATEQRGTSGERTSESASADVKIDASVRAKLVEFKRHLDQFHSTAMAQSGRGEEDTASADPQSGVTGAMTRTSPSTTTGSATAATGTTGSASTTSRPTTTSPETPQVTGTATTTGTAGTSGTSSAMQSTQTSAQATVDSAAIARLTAAIDEMLRGGSATSTTAGTTTSSAGTTTSGTVGTSGTSSATGTVCVDRAKLEELKTQIQALQNRPR
jgi:hypothetical protein